MESRETGMSKKENLSKEGFKRVNPQPFGRMGNLFKTSNSVKGYKTWLKF